MMFDYDELDFEAEYDPADVVRFTAAELCLIGRLAQNLLSSALEAEADPGLLEDIYLKTQTFLET